MVVSLAHQGLLHLVLNILHCNIVMHVEMIEDLRHNGQISRFMYTLKCLDDGIHDLVERKLVFRTVSLRDSKVLNLHIYCY